MISRVFRHWATPYALAALILTPLATDWARARWADPRDLFSVQAPSGPYEVLAGEGGAPSRGSARSTFRAGETVGWISNICLRDGVSMWGTLRMVSEDTGAQVTFRETPVATGRCGPTLTRIAIPESVPTGAYRIERWVAARNGLGPELSEALAPVRFTVSP